MAFQQVCGSCFEVISYPTRSRYYWLEGHVPQPSAQIFRSEGFTCRTEETKPAGLKLAMHRPLTLQLMRATASPSTTTEPEASWKQSVSNTAAAGR